MEALIGIAGENWVIMAADRLVARSIVVMKGSEDKFRTLTPTTTLVYSGESGSAVNFAEFIQANIKLYQMRNGVPLTPNAASHYARRLLADSLRSRDAYQANVLIGGVDTTVDENAGKLYWIDYLGTISEMPFAAHGYAAYFVLSLMDRHYRRDMNVEEGLALLKMCLLELKTRFIVNFPDFGVRIIRPNGTEELVISI